MTKRLPFELNLQGLGFDLLPRGQREHMPMVVLHFEAVDNCVDWTTVRWARTTYGEGFHMEPGAAVVNYGGPGVFEGLKLFRMADGRFAMFCPEQNAARLSNGAGVFRMPKVPIDITMQGLTELSQMFIEMESEVIPACGAGSVYLRPILFRSGATLGLGHPVHEYILAIYGMPVGEYFAGGFTGKKMLVSMTDVRAGIGGTGHTKSGSNYPLHVGRLEVAHAHGFSEILYLDAETHQVVDELGAGAFACIDRDGVIHTPPLTRGTILPSITRAWMIEEARLLGYTVEDRNEVPIDFLQQHCTAVFFMGTAAGIIPCHTLTRVLSIDDLERYGRRALGNVLEFQNSPDNVHVIVRRLSRAYNQIVQDVVDPRGLLYYVTL